FNLAARRRPFAGGFGKGSHYTGRHARPCGHAPCLACPLTAPVLTPSLAPLPVRAYLTSQPRTRPTNARTTGRHNLPRHQPDRSRPMHGQDEGSASARVRAGTNRVKHFSIAATTPRNLSSDWWGNVGNLRHNGRTSFQRAMHRTFAGNFN